jgi:23S rRNA pseudouridine1911/1915/1917 synthase
MELSILHDDNHVLALVKPACVPMVPDESLDVSLYDLAKDWVAKRYQKPGAVYLGVVHRLDRPVSGVVVFARTSKAAARLSESFRQRTTHKTYVALVEGQYPAREFAVEQWLLKDERTNVVQVVAAGTAHAKQAHTHLKVLRTLHGRSLVELQPLTGRPHQLRVACATHLGPIVGDLKYGARAALDDASIALHARDLQFDHPVREVRVAVSCAPPDRAWWRAFA